MRRCTRGVKLRGGGGIPSLALATFDGGDADGMARGGSGGGGGGAGPDVGNGSTDHMPKLSPRLEVDEELLLAEETPEPPPAGRPPAGREPSAGVGLGNRRLSNSSFGTESKVSEGSRNKTPSESSQDRRSQVCPHAAAAPPCPFVLSSRFVPAFRFVEAMHAARAGLWTHASGHDVSTGVHGGLV